MKSFDFINEAASNFSQTPIGYAKTTMNVQGSAPVISTTSNVASAPAQPINLKHVKKSLDSLSRSEKTKILKAIKTELNKKKIRKEGQIYFQGGGGPEAQHYYEPRHVPNQHELEKEASSILEGIQAEEPIAENLRKWFKEKWVRFGPDGKIRGACARGSESEGKPKCLPQSKAHALGKKGRKYAAAKKRREDPNPERRGPAKNVATKKKSNEGQLNELSPELLKRASAAAQTKYDQAADYGNKLSDTEAQALMKHYSQQQSKFAQGAKLAQNRSDRASSLAKIGMSDVAKRKTGVAEAELDEACWKGYHKEGNKKMFGKTYPNCVKNTNEEQEIEEGKRIPRKPGQPANSKKHSDLYTDENPKGTIQGLKFATAEDARASVSKIRNSGKSHAHKIQAAVAMEQRAKAAGKTEAASVYRKFINSIRKTNEEQLDEKCWDTHKQVGMKSKGGKMVPNCVPKESVEEDQAPMFTPESKCPHCGGKLFEFSMMNEKKDACYYKVKSRYKVWPSAYASGALVKCRKKGASNWGTGGKKNENAEQPKSKLKYDEYMELANEIQKRFNDAIRANNKELAKEIEQERIALDQRAKQGLALENLGMPYPGTYEQETLPYRTKGQKRTQSIAFETKQIEEKWSQKYKKSINCSNPKGFSQRAHCAGRKKK